MWNQKLPPLYIEALVVLRVGSMFYLHKSQNVFCVSMRLCVSICRYLVSAVSKYPAGQQSPEQLIEARKLFENLQSSERRKQQLEFQHQQLKLNLQQTKAAHAMELEFKKSMQLQETPLSRAIKLVLRKR